MKTFKSILEETEYKNKAENEMISKIIIKKLESICGITFRFEETDLKYSTLIQSILFIPAYDRYRDVLIYLLDQYEVNIKNIVTRFLVTVNQPKMTDEAKKIFENSFFSLPYCKYYELLEDGYIIETDEGTIEAHNLMKNVKNEELYKSIEKEKCQGYCHAAVRECIEKYKDYRGYNIVTSELEFLFTKEYFHSYYKSSDGKEIVDLAYNILYTNGTFDSFFEPNELLNIKAIDLEEEYDKLNRQKIYMEEPGTAKVLQLALHNKITQK